MRLNLVKLLVITKLLPVPLPQDKPCTGLFSHGAHEEHLDERENEACPTCKEHSEPREGNCLSPRAVERSQFTLVSFTAPLDFAASHERCLHRW